MTPISKAGKVLEVIEGIKVKRLKFWKQGSSNWVTENQQLWLNRCDGGWWRVRLHNQGISTFAPTPEQSLNDLKQRLLSLVKMLEQEPAQ